MLEHVERHAELLSRTFIRKIGDELQPSRKEISISRVQLHLQWIHCTTRVVESNIVAAGHSRDDLGRSEEHTSELQSLMRNSYAVFCLTKKKQIRVRYQS